MNIDGTIDFKKNENHTLIDFPNPCILHICGSWSNPFYCNIHKPWFEMCRLYRFRFYHGLPSPSRQLSLNL